MAKIKIAHLRKICFNIVYTSSDINRKFYEYKIKILGETSLELSKEIRGKTQGNLSEFLE